MQIAAIGAHGDMADIGREQTDEPGEKTGQDQQPEPFLWIPLFHEQSIPFNIISYHTIASTIIAEKIVGKLQRCPPHFCA